MNSKARSVLLLVLALALAFPPARAGDRLEVELDFSEPTPGNAALRSLLLPGWGQHFNRQKAKGTSLFLATAASLTGAVILRSRAQQTLSDYRNKGLPNDPLYDKYEDQHLQSMILQGATAGFWLFAVVDAYLQARIIPANQENLPGQHGPSFSFAPDGMTAAWRFGGESR